MIFKIHTYKIVQRSVYDMLIYLARPEKRYARDTRILLLGAVSAKLSGSLSRARLHFSRDEKKKRARKKNERRWGGREKARDWGRGMDRARNGTETRKFGCLIDVGVPRRSPPRAPHILKVLPLGFSPGAKIGGWKNSNVTCARVRPPLSSRYNIPRSVPQRPHYEILPLSLSLSSLLITILLCLSLFLSFSSSLRAYWHIWQS